MNFLKKLPLYLMFLIMSIIYLICGFIAGYFYGYKSGQIDYQQYLETFFD